MTALRQVVDGIADGLDYLGRQAGPAGAFAALLVLAYAVTWRLT